MQADLAAFLADHTPQAELTSDWDHGRFAFQVTGYLGPEVPPLEYVTSVRGLVFRGETMLCLPDAAGIHLFPGGRREVGETLEETLRREVLEESGYLLKALWRLGFMLFHHLNPAPPKYPYPYPDFLRLVYRAEAADGERNGLPGQNDEDQYAFRPITEVEALDLSPSQRLYLEAALSARCSPQ